VSREFEAFRARRTSPITNWLRALGRQALERTGSRGIGVVGMCFIGGFVLAMAVDSHVLAPVASQPTLPLPLTPALRGDLGITPSDLQRVADRARRGQLAAMALRFSDDRKCPRDRFETLRRELSSVERIQIDSWPGNPHGIRKSAHSVLTLSPSRYEGPRPPRILEQVTEQVVGLLRAQLQPAPDA
jgi:dienelactone hydrolase